MKNHRRHTILEIAQTLLQERGLRKMTISMIAQRADIAVGTVYLEFSSKGEILGELAHQQFQGILRAMRRASMSSCGPRERLKRMMWARTSAFIKLGKDDTLRHILFEQRGLKEVEYQRLIFRQRQLDLLHDFFEAISEDTPLPGEPGQSATTLSLAMISMEPPHVFAFDTQDREGHFDRLIDVLVCGLFDSKECPS